MSIAHLVSDSNAEGPPVPIPNTEVKLCSGENTCLATDWEDSSLPTQNAAKAVLVSDSNAEGPPVPIPNTEVKLCSGENTCLATDREDSSLLTNIAFDLILIVSYDWRYRKNLQVNSSLKGSNRKQGIYGNPVYPLKNITFPLRCMLSRILHKI